MQYYLGSHGSYDVCMCVSVFVWLSYSAMPKPGAYLTIGGSHQSRVPKSLPTNE